MLVKATTDAKDWWDIDKEVAEELEIVPSNPNYLIPHNPVLEVNEYGGVTIYGHIAPNWGTPEDEDDATMIVSLNLGVFNRCYSVELPDGTNLEGTGWIEA